MTREEAISIITKERDEDIFGCWTPYRKRIHEAFTLAIEALEGVCFDEWCDDCKEYDTEKKCCPRFNRVIKGALEREPSEDEPQDDLISRAEAIETIEIVDWYHQNSNKDMVHGANDNEHQAWYKAQDIYKALETIPPADRPRGEWIEETSWKYKKGGRNSDMKEILGTEWMTMIRQRCSECNKVTMVDGSILYKYCPHCGSDMRGENE